MQSDNLREANSCFKIEGISRPLVVFNYTFKCIINIREREKKTIFSDDALAIYMEWNSVLLDRRQL